MTIQPSYFVYQIILYRPFQNEMLDMGTSSTWYKTDKSYILLIRCSWKLDGYACQFFGFMALFVFLFFFFGVVQNLAPIKVVVF